MNDSAIENAVSWMEGVMVGSLAPIVTTLAVAAIGFLMLSGRIDARRGVRVLLGCFIIFGASTIASGLISTFAPSTDTPAPDAPEPPLQAVTAPEPSAASTPVTPFDPYAGAAMPTR